MSKMYVHLAFAVSRTPEVHDLQDRAFVTYTVEDDNEFKYRLGQTMMNMVDLYRVATGTDIKDGESIDPVALKIMGNASFLEVIQWIKDQRKKAGKDIQVQLGSAYQELVDFLNENSIKVIEGVDIKLNLHIGTHDKRVCEEENEGS